MTRAMRGHGSPPAQTGGARQKDAVRECGGGRYNVFLFDEPWVGDYFWLIKRAFHKYIEVSTAIQCWYSHPVLVQPSVPCACWYSHQWRGLSGWYRPMTLRCLVRCSSSRGPTASDEVASRSRNPPSSHYQFQFPLVPVPTISSSSH